MKRILSLLLIAFLAVSLTGCKCHNKKPTVADIQVGQLVYDVTICQQYFVTETDDITKTYTVRDSTGKMFSMSYSSAGLSKDDCVKWDPVQTSPMPDPDVPPAGVTNGGPSS